MKNVLRELKWKNNWKLKEWWSRKKILLKMRKKKKDLSIKERCRRIKNYKRKGEDEIKDDKDEKVKKDSIGKEWEERKNENKRRKINK